MGKKQNKNFSRVIAVNRKAFHDFHIMEKFEVGLVLKGTEVKSIRCGQVNLKDSYAKLDNGELWVHGVHISPYSHGNRENHDPTRPRKLLLHRYEISRLISKTQEQGSTLVLLKLYWKKNRIKGELGLAKGKKLHDKRQTIKDRDVKRQIAQAMRRDS